MTFPSCPDCGSSEPWSEVFACENADCEHHEGFYCQRCAKATNANAGECPYCAEYGPKAGEVVPDGAARDADADDGADDGAGPEGEGAR